MIDRHHVLLDCSRAGFDPVVALCRKSHSTAAQRTARSDERFMGDAVRDFEAGDRAMRAWLIEALPILYQAPFASAEEQR